MAMIPKGSRKQRWATMDCDLGKFTEPPSLEMETERLTDYMKKVNIFYSPYATYRKYIDVMMSMQLENYCSDIIRFKYYNI